MNKHIVYTVGHSTHKIDYFLELLTEYRITCVVDVRSVAASSYNPQYNKEPFSNFLKNNGITYLHFAEEFGARHNDPELLDDEGKVDFEKIQKSWNFKNGVEKLWQEIDKGYIIVLMCSESDPLICHRFSMVSTALEKNGLQVMHILKDKSLKSNIQLEKQLLREYEKLVLQPSIFQETVTLYEQIKLAYRLKNKEIAFSPYSTQPETKYD
jgi:uncharacterized protein (DUF488 family)